MELCKFKDPGTSVRIVPGPNGISFPSEEQNDGKFIDGNFDNNIQGNGIVMNGNRNDSVRDASFSSYLGREEEEYNHQSTPAAIEKNFLVSVKAGADGFAFGSYPYAGGHVRIQDGIKEKQTPCRIQSLAVVGNLRNDSEINIFEAKKYFSAEEEKKTVAKEPRTDVSNSEVKTNALFTSGQLYDSSAHRFASPLPSMDSVSRGFNPQRSTPTASSGASWNSYSGLLPQSAYKFPGKKSSSGKWGVAGFGCTCPCWNKKSVQIENSLKENRRTNSVTSSAALVDSPLSSIRYSYPGLGKRVLTRSIEKQRSEVALEENASEISDIGHGMKSLQNLLTPIVNQNSGISKDRELIQKIHRNNASFGRYGRNSHEEKFRDKERVHQTRSVFAKEDGFSFPVLHVSQPEEKPRLSLEVFGSTFPTTPDRHEDRHSPDMHRRSPLFSLDKAPKSFAFISETSKFMNNSNARELEDGDQGKESDSSSDLFEIESLATQGTCYPSRGRDSVDDTFSNQSGYPAMNLSHFGGMEEPVTPSAQSSCYEPSEVSLDWSANTGETIDKASLGNFSSDFEDLRMMKRRPLKGSDRYKGGSNSKRSSGRFLGCGSQKALSVVPPTHVSNMNKYDRRGISMSKFRSDSFGTVHSEKRVTNINSSSLSGQRSTARSVCRARH